jgi:transcriptional regulator with XRE-family HTH domain
METDELSEALRAATTGQQLRIIREHTGYSLGKLARAADIDKGYLSRIENGHVLPPTGQTWDRYAQALLAPLTGTDHETARDALTGITNMGTLSAAAISRIIGDHPILANLLLYTARVGLTAEETRALGNIVGSQSRRDQDTAAHTHGGKIHGRPILRERRSSAKAKEHDEPL